MSEPDKHRNPSRALAGLAMLVLGALILVVTGPCSAIIGFNSLFALIISPKDFLAHNSDTWELLPLIFAAAAIGIVLLRTELRLWRAR